MTTYNTGNPLGSSAVKDSYDNAQNLDYFANGSAPTYPDRLGNPRYSVAGMNSAFVSEQERRVTQFNTLLASFGFTYLGEYAAGLTFTTRQQYVMRQGLAYVPANAATLPLTLTGNFTTDQVNLKLVNPDSVLRTDLAQATGVGLVGGSYKTYTSYSDLTADSASTAAIRETSGYYAAGDGGHGSYAFKTGVGWSLLHWGTVNILQFGAKTGFEFNNYTAITAAKDAVKNFALAGRGGVIDIPNGVFTYAGTLELDAQCCTIRGQGLRSSMLRGTTLDQPLLRINAPFCAVQGCEISSSGPGVVGSSGIEVNAAQFTADCFSITGVYDGIRFRAGSLHRLTRFSIEDCKNTGILINGNAPEKFINDVFIDEWFIGSNDPSNFQLGQFRFVGRCEAIVVGKGDGIGGTYSVTCDSDGTPGMRYCAFQAGSYFDSTLYGAVFTDAEHLHFSKTWFSNGRTTGSPGVTFNNCAHFTTDGLQSYNCGGQGVVVNNCREFTMVASELTANGQDTAQAGCLITNSTSFSFLGGTGGRGEGAVRRQTYGLIVGVGCSDYSVCDTKFKDNATGPMAEDAGNSARSVRGNSGYVTQNKGSSALPTSATSVTVNHGLSRTPAVQDISITPNGASASTLFVTAADAGSFTVQTLGTNAGPTPFSWRADVSS